MSEGRKYDADKPRWDLLPWEEAEDVVKVLTFGSKKYADDNWKFVADGERRYFAAAMRHIAAARAGEQADAESGLHPYAHAICDLMMAYWHSQNPGLREICPKENTDGK